MAAKLTGAIATDEPVGSPARPGREILVGLGAATTTYKPPITATPSTVELRCDVRYDPPLASTDDPSLKLMAHQAHGSVRASTQGPTTDPDMIGALSWSDGTTSGFTLDTLHGERVKGHYIGRITGEITSGHYAGASVDLLNIRLAGDSIDGTIPFSHGSVAAIIALP